MFKKLLPLSFLLICVSVLQAQTDPKKQNVQLRSRLSLGKNCANICGYAANGREYALVGTTAGISIVEVTNPDLPKLIKEIPAVTSQWREIKVYKNYAYVTTEGTGQGLQIVNLTNLPDTSIAYKDYKGGDSTLVSIDRVHALHIDENKGFIYLFGGASRIKPTDTSSTTITVNGAVVLDLKDPWNPKFAGMYNGAYIHDGFALNDTLFGGHIFNGYFSIIDFKNKKSPNIFNTQTTPTAFTHNVWLSDNHKIIFTTDENNGSYLGAFDISDPHNIKFLDKIRSTSGQNAIVHNTHILNDFAVTSWYTEGFTIVDAKRPQNLVQVGQYDTYDAGLTGFHGAWGVYPFLPSGTVIVSNIEDGLFVLTPTYKRASYLEGNVVDSLTNQPLSGVKVKINSTDMDKGAESNIQGNYYTGQVTPGSFEVTYSKAGYYPKTVTISLTTAQVTTQNIKLNPLPRLTVSGKVVDATTNVGISNALINLTLSDQSVLSTNADAQGNFSISNVIDLSASINVTVGVWGYRHKVVTGFTTGTIIKLETGYQDDFWGDFGWTISGTIPAGAINQGRWERVVPIQSTFNGITTSPANDINSDIGNQCFITGNGGNAGENDVDNGSTIITSPIMKLRNSPNSVLSFSYWFYDGGGSGTPPPTPNDKLQVILSNGLKDTVIRLFTANSNGWLNITGLNLKSFLPLTDSMRVSFSVADDDPGHIVEAGIDGFSVTIGTPTVNIAENWQIKSAPNPFSSQILFEYKLDDEIKNARLSIFNSIGQLIDSQVLPSTEGVVQLGEKLGSGIYFVRIESGGKFSKIERIVKK